ncbi:anoctamin-1-like isoform X1 [Ischnura elegans]|uniref:anoctamin-1-like isoform X1 n=1 Tax=Ischnura elegans TaxID=197161 RepID=UPI001ED89C78|nr:anoctamin-1-like isoform X1 [Ischnura elegans]
MDEENFEDTLSFNSNQKSPKDSINMSKFSVYHSAQDLRDEVPSDTVDIPLTETKIEECEANIRLEEKSLYFRDGVKKVDFIIACDGRSPESRTKEAREKRRIFENNLIDEGLILEKEQNDDGSGFIFVKIHAPKEVLCRYCEIMKLRMPMRELHDHDEKDSEFDLIEEVKSLFRSIVECIFFDSNIFRRDDSKLMAVYSRDKDYLFDCDCMDFFTPAVRSTVVDFILERKHFSNNERDVFSFGIQRLINEKIYSAAYPLHDGSLKAAGTVRYHLSRDWASVKRWAHYQPLDQIRDYFGEKFAIYFAWLGFYTNMLILPSIVGILCFIYGCATVMTNQLSNEICDENNNITMCPLCDRKCDYWRLNDTCLYSRITYLFDNPTTVFFAIFMSFWAALFLEMWKRYSAGIVHRWGLTGFSAQAEHPRPEYLARLANAKRHKVNVVTHAREPYVPFWKIRVPATILSYSVVLLLISVAVGAVFAVVLYRMCVVSSLHLFGDTNDALFIPATAGLLNLVCIMLLNWIYDRLAVYLTELELLRTQTEFEDSLTLKIYLFQFVNYYTSIFYIAFLKGQYVGYPKKYTRIFNLRQEECNPGGCLMELCMQLAIIMVGKQALNTVLEMFMPFVWKTIKAFTAKTGLVQPQEESRENIYGTELSATQWAHDFKLLEWGPRGLFYEYLELVLQYGFVTIFVAAFPLAPFFALLNNVFEMRLDAKKFLTFYRRPVPRRVRDIGVWFHILEILGKVAVITNGMIIAFTSNFVPKIVYALTVSEEPGSLEGYLNHTLSFFNTSDFPPDVGPQNTSFDVEICRYPSYREPYNSENKYKRTEMYWHVLAARLAFVVVFQNVVSLVTMAVQWIIPDMPRKLRDEIQREAYLTNEIIIQEERNRAKRARGNSGDYSTPRVPSGRHTDASARGDGNGTPLLYPSISKRISEGRSNNSL